MEPATAKPAAASVVYDEAESWAGVFDASASAPVANSSTAKFSQPAKTIAVKAKPTTAELDAEVAAVQEVSALERMGGWFHTSCCELVRLFGAV
jgi:hypothetical protein